MGTFKAGDYVENTKSGNSGTVVEFDGTWMRVAADARSAEETGCAEFKMHVSEVQVTGKKEG